MSLDVYLTTKKPVVRQHSGIFVRRDGATVEISREEWDDMCPGHEPTVVDSASTTHQVFERNITHNLGCMAKAAGVYQHLWRPEELKLMKAGELVEPLRAGLRCLQSDPAKFKALNPSNGWGDYEGLVAFVRAYLAACEDYPQSNIEVSR